MPADPVDTERRRIAEELDDALWDAANAPGKAQYHVLRETVERIARELAPAPTTRRRRP